MLNACILGILENVPVIECSIKYLFIVCNVVITKLAVTFDSLCIVYSTAIDLLLW